MGTFNGIADFDTTDSDPTTHSHLVFTTGTYPNPDSPTGYTYLESAFVAKYNADGQCLWVVPMTSELPDAVKSTVSAIAYDSTNGGRVVVTGDRSTGTVFRSAGKDGSLAWLDVSYGSVEAVQTFGSTRDEDTGADIAVDASGNAYVTGSIENASASIFYNRDIYVAKFNSNTTKAWEKVIGGSSYPDYGTAIAIDANGIITIGGNFEGTVDFDPGRGTYSLQSGSPKVDHPTAGFVLQLNNTGTFRWANAFQVSQTFSSSGVKELVVDGSGNITVSGYFHGKVDLNPDKRASNLATSTSGSDGFLVRLNSTGKYVWGTTQAEDIQAMTVGADGEVYVTGAYQQNADDSWSGYFARLDSTNGSLEYLLTLAGDGGRGIVVDSSGTVYMAGFFTGMDVDFDFGAGTWYLTAENNRDGMYVMKFRI